MRPIKLKMVAFEPYAETVNLDFEKGLAGENFFLIHGATGAGKTSILDAICYALYDDSSGGGRDGKMMRSNQAPPNLATEVEFEFALGDNIYKVRRNPECKMPRGIADKKAEAELYRNGKLISRSARDVTQEIRKIIGFGVEQFRQVILLPQGNFQKFLMSKSKDRGDILNAIFNANLYATIETELKNKSIAAKNILEDLDKQHRNYLENAREIGEIQSDENIPALIETVAANLQTSKNKCAESKILADKAVAAWNAGEILSKQFENLAAANINLQNAQAALKKITADLAVAQIEYEKRQAEESKRRELENKIANLQKVNAALAELRKKQNELATAEENWNVAQNKLREIETKRQNYESRLADLKRQMVTLQGADVDLKSAEQTLKDAREREACLREIERLTRELHDAEGRLETANKNYDAAQRELKRLQFVQKMCTAAKLAESLIDGEPCPVCGALHHPNPTVTDEIIPTDEEIAQAERILERRERERELTNQSVTNIGGRIEAQKILLQKLVNALALTQAQEIFNSANEKADKLKDCQARLQSGEIFTNQVLQEIEPARNNFDAATRRLEKLRGTVEEMQRQIPEIYLTQPNKIDEDLNVVEREKQNLDVAWKIAEEKFHRLENQKSKCEGEVKSAENACNDAAAKVAGKSKPDIDALKRDKTVAQNLHNAAIAEMTTLENNLQRLHDISKKISELNKKIQSAKQNYQIWQRLSDAATGKNSKVSFQRYYLNAIFKDVIFEANERLSKMSGERYQFLDKERVTDRRTSGGLDLEIFDAYAGTARDVKTLSGGESFLASLSLALGLAAVVKNTAGGIKLDTIFIDEGFGSLDSETLDVAMNALIDLQSGGRLVGIISHVDELKSRIPVRLEVTKNKFGSTAKFVR